MHDIAILRDKSGLGFPDAAKHIKAAAKAALKAQGICCDCQINVLLTDDEAIREINKGTRGIDAPTDVLSFPQNELSPGAFDEAVCDLDYDSGRIMLGDMVISLERCSRQADEYGHDFAREVSYLTVHSVLHLLGYDHMDEGQQRLNMRNREKEIMGRLYK